MASGNIDALMNYSENEIIIGKWINGSTIYRKAGKTRCANGAGVEHTLATIPNIIPIKMNATCTNDYDSVISQANGCTVNATVYCRISYVSSTGIFFFRQDWLNAGFDVYWSIDYIKKQT